MGYFHTALGGFTWISFLRLSMRILAFVRIAVLARIFLPFQFGVFGIAAMTVSLLEMLMETGINVFLIQQEENIEKYLNTAWVISLVRGLVISLVILIFSLPISRFFNSEESLGLIVLISLVPLIRGFINPASIRFQKYLEFNREFSYRLSIIFAEAVFTIGLAVFTRSITSLALGMIFATVLEVILSFVLVRPWPKLQVDIQQIKQILSVGKWVTMFAVIDYLFTQGDNIVVGRMLGVSALGLYQNAYKISTTPVTETIDIFHRVTFPVFSKMSQNSSSLKSGVYRSALVMAGLVIALGLGINLFARPLVLILLGANWTSAIPLVQVLAFLGIARGLAYMFNPLFLALKKQKLVTIITSCSTLGLIITIVPLISKYGIIGAGYSAVISSLLAVPISFYFARKIIKTLA